LIGQYLPVSKGRAPPTLIQRKGSTHAYLKEGLHPCQSPIFIFVKASTRTTHYHWSKCRVTSLQQWRTPLSVSASTIDHGITSLILLQDRPEGGLSEHNRKFAKSIPPVKSLKEAVDLIKPNTLIGEWVKVILAQNRVHIQYTYLQGDNLNPVSSLKRSYPPLPGN